MFPDMQHENYLHAISIYHHSWVFALPESYITGLFSTGSKSHYSGYPR
jgi:hypothetical protein